MAIAEEKPSIPIVCPPPSEKISAPYSSARGSAFHPATLRPYGTLQGTWRHLVAEPALGPA